MGEGAELSVGLPLDTEGFLRRECPTCGREFKWFASVEGDGEPPHDGGYFCPYCGIQAPPDAWFTTAQIEYANNLVAREIVGPELDKFKREFDRFGRSSGGFIRTSARVEVPDALDPLTETDDMHVVVFNCHPTEPLKVADDWIGELHCLICGQTDGHAPESSGNPST